MRKIKLAQVITRMDWAGSSDIVRLICQNLRKDTYEIRLIVGKSKNLTAKNKEFLEKFSKNIIKVPFLKREINPLLDLFTFLHLWLIFRREKFAIVHTHTSKAGFLGRIAAKLVSKSKTIYMPHGHIFYGYFSPLISRIFIFLEKLAGLFTDKIITLTQLEKKDFLSLGIKKEKDILVVPSGIEVSEVLKVKKTPKSELKRKFGFDLEEKLVGMACRLEPVKGPIYFIEAIPHILKNFNKVRFLIIGEGSQLGFLKDRVKSLGIEDKVLFLGWREDILEIIYILDILVQPSLNEAVGRILLEAQLLGVGVVATRVGGISEIVKDRLTGRLVPPQDSLALAEAVLELLKNEKEREFYSLRAQEWVKERFSSYQMVEEIERIYNLLLDEQVF